MQRRSSVMLCTVIAVGWKHTSSHAAKSVRLRLQDCRKPRITWLEWNQVRSLLPELGGAKVPSHVLQHLRLRHAIVTITA